MRELAQYWWAVALRGLFALLFGLAALLVPGLALATLALLFGAYALLDGVSAIASALGGREGGRRWPLLLLGLLGVAAGLLTFLNPAVTALTLLSLIAAWAIVTGVLEVVAAVRMREAIPGAGEWLVGLSGVLSAVFGLLLILNPAGGALAVSWLIGVYALAAGVVLLSLGFRLRGQNRPTATA